MKFYMAAILAIAFLELFSVCIIRGSLGSQTRPRSVCEGYHEKPIKKQRVVDYEKLEHGLAKDAILTLRDGSRVCVKLERPWVKNIIHYVDRKKKSTEPQ
ncbi:lymphotactin-like [Podarcis lilfordi]|uniref:Lymphotactin-like n=1 Tax=Podarcis lilfordi TaxID=74358 RepID=A0AA35K7I3_9SAUR|nr:lymphotactin-like [Podarcis lilfordi]